MKKRGGSFFRPAFPLFIQGAAVVNPAFIFSLIAAVVSLGGILIAVGVFKGRVHQNAEANRSQAAQIEKCATRTELNAEAAWAEEQLAAAIKRSDELLELMRKRAEEDRASGEGRYRELYALLGNHGERIKAVETTQKAIDKALEEIKDDIKIGFTEVKTELKELRKN
jgi:hypothetical protein